MWNSCVVFGAHLLMIHSHYSLPAGGWCLLECYDMNGILTPPPTLPAHALLILGSCSPSLVTHRGGRLGDSPSLSSLSSPFFLPILSTHSITLLPLPLQVAAHYPRAMYRYNETQQAMREEQYYRFETDLQYESQMLMYTTNLTLLSNSVPPAVIIRWGGRETEPIAFDEITVADIGKLEFSVHVYVHVAELRVQ